MGSNIQAIGMQLAMLPVELTKYVDYKIVRLFSWLFTITIWMPVLLTGLFITLIGVLIEIYQEI